MATLLRSQVECPECGELIASIHRHDFRSCGCGKTYIDGGRDYLRLGGDAICARAHEFNRSVSIEEDIDGATASRVLMVLKSTSDKTHWPLTMIVNMVATKVWDLRKAAGYEVGLPADIKVSRTETLRHLELLGRNGLVSPKYVRGRRMGWKRLVALAEHPDAP